LREERVAVPEVRHHCDLASSGTRFDARDWRIPDAT
jgi:hypothetical protein